MYVYIYIYIYTYTHTHTITLTDLTFDSLLKVGSIDLLYIVTHFK
jgi:hypothetical protein